MKTSVSVSLPASQQQVFDYLCDLASFQELIALVHSVEPSVESGDRVWTVELRAKIGPFARSKKLRMVRTFCEPHGRATFERQELDSKDHAPWVLGVQVSPAETGCEATLSLEYGGRLWSANVMEKVLRDSIEEGTECLRKKFS